MQNQVDLLFNSQNVLNYESLGRHGTYPYPYPYTYPYPYPYIINRISMSVCLSVCATMRYLLLNEKSFWHAVFCKSFFDEAILQCFGQNLHIILTFGYKWRHGYLIG